MEKETRDAQDVDEPGAAGPNQHPKEEPAPDILERLVSWMSLLLLLGAAGFLVWESTQHKAPPAFQTRIQRIWSSGGHHYVSFSVRNVGGKSVQNLEIQALLLEGEKTISTSEVQLSWLPAHSERQATVIFNKDPRLRDLRVQPKGYEEP